MSAGRCGISSGGVIQLSSKIDCGDSCDYSKNIKLCSLKG